MEIGYRDVKVSGYRNVNIKCSIIAVFELKKSISAAEVSSPEAQSRPAR